jgi:predicted DNA-binding mobile mystery protein A
MATYELADRMGVTASAVSQLERAERSGTIGLASLERAARGLDCQLYYVLVPRESLEQVVHRQALDKAARLVAARTPRADLAAHDPEILAQVVQEQVEALAYELIDQRGLWRTPTGSDSP